MAKFAPLVGTVAEQQVMGPNMNFDELSTTMKCIISLTIQYMVVFTGLGIVRSYLDFTKVRFSDWAACIRKATHRRYCMSRDVKRINGMEVRQVSKTIIDFRSLRDSMSKQLLALGTYL